jgi:hypothetical protein
MSSTTRKNRFFGGKYLTIKVNEQKFILSETQIYSEPESIFVDFLPNGRAPDLDVDASIFRLIHAHLKGYEIFPLPPQGIPCGAGTFDSAHSSMLPYLSKEATLKNLWRDATDFGLNNLVTKIEQEMAKQLESSRRKERQPPDDDQEAMEGFVMLGSV